MPRRASTLTALLAMIQLVACAPQSPAPLQPAIAQRRAPFSVSATSPTGADCAMTLRADGTVYQRANDFEVVIPHASVAVTRVNDKRIDVLHMQIAIGRPSPPEQMVVMHGETPNIVLAPTVDSATPQLTTWQSDDTLRFLMSWRPTTAPQALHFNLAYLTVSYTGEVKRCTKSLQSDTLRFAPGPSK